MDENVKLQTIEIENEQKNIPVIIADDITISRLLSAFCAIFLYLAILILIAVFGPKLSTTFFSSVLMKYNPKSPADSFQSNITNISTMNQIIRVSLIYNNLSSLESKLDHSIKTTINANSFDRKGKQINSLSYQFETAYSKPLPIFQTALINFDSLELSGTIYSEIQMKHNITFKYEYFTSDATFFQLKIQMMLVIISFSILLYLIYIRSSNLIQFFTIFLFIAQIFYLQPFHFIQIYFPNPIFIPFEWIFQTIGTVYVYFYCLAVFIPFEDKMNKAIVGMNLGFVILFAVFRFLTTYESIFEAIFTINPQEYNANHYNYEDYIKNIQMKHYSTNSNVNQKQIAFEALEESFKRTSTITKLNISNKEFLFWTIVFSLPLVITILYSILNVTDAYYQRIIVFSISLALFAFLFIIFYGLNLILGLFVDSLLEWFMPLALVSAFSLLFSYLTLNNDFNLGYIKAEKSGNDGSIQLLSQNENDDGLGLEEDLQQIEKKEKQKLMA